MMSGKDLVKLLKKLLKREEQHNIIAKIKPIDVPEVDHSMQVDDSMQVDEGVVDDTVKISPVARVPRDTVLDAGPIKSATSSLAMPPPKFPGAASNDHSIISKQLCDVKLPGFVVNSKLYVRFRRRDDKVFAPDLLVRMGKSKTITDANDAILKLVKKGILKDLSSLEIDSKFIVIADKTLILMSLPDAIELLHRIDVHTIVKDIIMPPIEVVATSDAVVDVIVPVIEVATAADAARNVIMPPIAVVVGADAARPVAVKIRMRKVPASVLKTISGFENLLDSSLEGKEVRQVEPGQVDEKGEAIGGKWVISDGVSACTGDSAVSSNQWVKNKKNVDKEKAKSLTYIDSGNNAVGS